MARSSYLVWGLCSWFLVVATAAKSDRILNLKVTDFDTIIPSHPRLLVLFEAGWCPTSSAALKLLENLVEQKSEFLQTLGVRVAKLSGADQAEAEEFRSKLGIEEYPHISLFLHGAQIRYLSQIDDLTSLLSFLETNAHSDSREANLQDIRHSLSNDEARVLLFFGKKGHPRFSVFLEACLYFKDVICFHGDDHLVAEEWKLGTNHLYLLAKQEPVQQYRAGWRREKLFEWVHEQSVPLFPELDSIYSQRILEEQTPALVLALGPHGQHHQEAEEDQKILAFLKQHPKLYSSKYLTAHCTHESSSCKKFLNALPVQIEHPSLFLVLFHPNHDEPLIFVYKHHELHQSSLRNWLSDVQQGKILMEFRSEQTKLQADGILKIGYEGLKTCIGGEHDILIIFGDDAYFAGDSWNTIRQSLSRLVLTLKDASYSGITIAYFNQKHNSVYGLGLQAGPEARFYRQGEATIAGKLRGSQLHAAGLTELLEDLATHPLPLSEPEQPDM